MPSTYMWRTRFLAEQINTQADADAWLAALTSEELIGYGMTLSDVSVEVTETTAILRFTVSTEEGTDYAVQETPLGGWFAAQQDQLTVYLFAESDESFTNRFEPATQ